MTRRTFKVDFNEQNEYGHIYARSDALNDRVSMLDGDGNYCEGEIIAVRPSGMIDIDPDWSTWVPVPTVGPVTSEDPRIQRNHPPRPAPPEFGEATTGEMYLG